MKAWGRLFRLQTMGATAMGPVLGAMLAIGLDWRLILVFVLGCFVHLTGFATNNWFDRNMDSASHSNPLKWRSGKAELNRGVAKNVILSLYVVMFILPLLFGFNLYGYVMFLASVLLGIYYNSDGKWEAVAPFVLGLWMFTLTLSGFLFFDANVGVSIIALALVGFIQLWLQWFEGLLKDWDNEFWNKICGRHPIYKLNPATDDIFWISKAVQVVFAAGLFALLCPDSPIVRLFAVSLMCASIVIWMFLLGLVQTPDNRDKLLRLSGIHEIIVYAFVPVCMWNIIGLWSIVYILLPTLMFVGFNRLLYGTFGRPKI